MIVSDFKRGKIKLRGTVMELSGDLAYAVCEFFKSLAAVGVSTEEAVAHIREVTEKAIKVAENEKPFSSHLPVSSQKVEEALNKYKELRNTGNIKAEN